MPWTRGNWEATRSSRRLPESTGRRGERGVRLVVGTEEVEKLLPDKVIERLVGPEVVLDPSRRLTLPDPDLARLCATPPDVPRSS